MIDGVQTLINAVFGNYAKGFILQGDLTLKPTYIAKGNNLFAHGYTLREAIDALNDKLFEDMDEDERIAAFLECHNFTDKYPVRDLYEWHHKLTGGCEAGRQSFARDHEIDIDNDEMTVREFVELTKNAYGGEIIERILEHGKEI